RPALGCRVQAARVEGPEPRPGGRAASPPVRRRGRGANAVLSRSSHRHDRTTVPVVVVEGSGSRGVGEPERPVHEKGVAIPAGRERHYGGPLAAPARESHWRPRGVPVVEIADQRHGSRLRGDEDERKVTDWGGRAL